MKLVWCDECKFLFSLKNYSVIWCTCKTHAGKYLSDNITAVVTKGCKVIGIDNNTFNGAVAGVDYLLKEGQESRIDLFFTGWIPTHPGEVIYVETIDDVVDYRYESDKNVESTMPVSMEEVING